MTRPVFVYKADPQRGRQWAEIFREEAPEIDFRLWADVGNTADVRYLAAWEPPAPTYPGSVFARYRALVGSASEGAVLRVP
jgi:glyoxylate/hydroxypyruvate reductase A